MNENDDKVMWRFELKKRSDGSVHTTVEAIAQPQSTNELCELGAMLLGFSKMFEPMLNDILCKMARSTTDPNAYLNSVTECLAKAQKLQGGTYEQ